MDFTVSYYGEKDVKMERVRSAEEMFVSTNSSLLNWGESLLDGLYGLIQPSSACEEVHNSSFSRVRQRLSRIFSYLESWLSQGSKQSALSLNS